MKKFILGVLIGFLASWLIDCINGTEPIYDWLLAIMDKPFFITHGMCFVIILIFALFAFILARELTQNYYKACQDLIQLSISRFDKMIQNALKK